MHSRNWHYCESNIPDESKSSKMTGLYDSIKRHQSYLVNYEERDPGK